MIKNLEAEAFFSTLSAHDEVATALSNALMRLGAYELRRAAREYGAIYATTAGLVFCGAAGMSNTYWRLRPEDLKIAIATGAEPAPLGSDWVQIKLFRKDWPQPDLEHWALRAYDFARAGK